MAESHNQSNSTNDEPNPLRDIQLSFIGSGVMAESMIAGLLRQGLVTPSQIVGSHPRSARRDELRSKYGIHVTESNREAATYNRSPNELKKDAPSDSIIVLAVKPQRITGVFGELQGALVPAQLVLSIV